VYVQGQEVVLVSEMEAGWYRYVSQWRLHTDGTIRPRFGILGSCELMRLQHSPSPLLLATGFRSAHGGQ